MPAPPVHSENSRIATPRGLQQLSIAECSSSIGLSLTSARRHRGSGQESARYNQARTPRGDRTPRSARISSCLAPATPSYEAAEDDECCICLAETRSRTVCRHPVCYDCLRQLSLLVPGKCPLCRRMLFDGSGEIPIYSARRRESAVNVEALADLVHNAQIGDLRHLIADSSFTQALSAGSLEYTRLREACTVRVIQLAPNLTFRDLARNVDVFDRLRSAALLPTLASVGTDTDDSAAASRIAAVLDAALETSFRVRFPLPQADRQESRSFPTTDSSQVLATHLTLQSLRPAANLLLSFREMGYLRSGGAASTWLAERVLHVVRSLCIDSSFSRHLRAAWEFCTDGLLERRDLESLVDRKWHQFKGSDDSAVHSAESLEQMHNELLRIFSEVPETPRAHENLSARARRISASETQVSSIDTSVAEVDLVAEQRQEVEHLAIERRLRERLKAEAEAEEQRRAAAALQRQQQDNEAEELERKKQAEQQQRALIQKVEEDSQKVQEFLSAHGYAGINAQRRRRLKTKYPLHTAVKGTDAGIVSLLLAAKADPTVKNWLGKTPAQVVQELNYKSSRAQHTKKVLRLLAASGRAGCAQSAQTSP